MRKAAGCGLVLFAVLAGARTSAAEGCPAPVGAHPRVAAIDPMARLTFLHDTLDRQASYAQLWTWGWGVTGVALAWGSFTLADRTSSDANRTDYIIGGSASLLIPISVLVTPQRVKSDAPMLDALMASTDGGRAGTCVVLARAEELTERDAKDQLFNVSLLPHLASLGVNTLIFAILGAMGHWTNAWVDLVGGIALSEFQIWTVPTGAARAWKHYRAGKLVGPKASAWSVGPMGVPGGPGLGVRASF